MNTNTEFTKKHKKYFDTPRTMEEIMNDLFKGDAWAANAFQNIHLIGRNLKIVTLNGSHMEDKNGKLFIVNENWYSINDDTARAAAHC